METNIELQNALDKLDDHLFKSIALAQNVISSSGQDNDMANELDVFYQFEITLLYNFMKDQVKNKL
jgi:hypothetical protein